MGRDQHASADLSAREFNRRVADPEQFSGGGSVAAMAAAGAASVALLVMRLNARRRSNATQASVVEAGIAEVSSLTERFYRAADEDLWVLDRLLIAQRAAKRTGERDAYRAALTAAAESPIALARDVGALLARIDEHVPLSTRFTVSDLAAAAAIAEAAGRAALVTAEVNLALLKDDPDVNIERVRQLVDETVSLRQSLGDSATRIEREARSRLGTDAFVTRRTS
jgi:formiminotetrahydrofolate cyclodeaminase